MSVAQTVSSYAKEILARLKGDTDAAIAEKNARRAKNAFNGVVSSINSEIAKAEDVLEQATEDFGNALYPTTLINDSDRFYAGVVHAEGKRKAAEKNLNRLKENLAFVQNLLDTKF